MTVKEIARTSRPVVVPPDPVTLASEQSFPASDPPSFNPGTAAPAPQAPPLKRSRRA
jgi:hypothetical protein